MLSLPSVIRRLRTVLAMAVLIPFGLVPSLLVPSARASVPGPLARTAAAAAAAPHRPADSATALAAAVDGLRRTRTAALDAAAEAAVELSRLTGAQTTARHGLDDALRVLEQQRAAQGTQVRQLYVAGGSLTMLGELLTGGRPDDLIDRARFAIAATAGSATSQRITGAAAREAADLAAQVGALAEKQIALATLAGQRVSELTAALSVLSAQLAVAEAAARRAALQRSAEAARRAALAAAAARAATGAAELRAAQAATAAFLTAARRAGELGSRYVPPGTVPAGYNEAIRRAGKRCPPVLSPALLAAQMAIESGWNPLAVSSAGAQGLAQFLPGTWAEYGLDGNGDGLARVFDPFDAIPSAAVYDCAVSRMIAGVPGDPVDLMLAAYNAGPNAVLAAAGVPAIPSVAQYIARIRTLAASYPAELGQLP